jgi:protein phosphatase 1L
MGKGIGLDQLLITMLIKNFHDILFNYSINNWLSFFFNLVQVSNQEAVDIARSFCVGSNRQGPSKACKKLVDLSASRGSIDDISVMIIELHNYI